MSRPGIVGVKTDHQRGVIALSLQVGGQLLQADLTEEQANTVATYLINCIGQLVFREAK